MMTTSAVVVVLPEHITHVPTLPTVYWAGRCRPATGRLPVTCVSHYKLKLGHCELSPTRPLEQGRSALSLQLLTSYLASSSLPHAYASPTLW